jgi:hypothetical protein
MLRTDSACQTLSPCCVLVGRRSSQLWSLLSTPRHDNGRRAAALSAGIDGQAQAQAALHLSRSLRSPSTGDTLHAGSKREIDLSLDVARGTRGGAAS